MDTVFGTYLTLAFFVECSGRYIVGLTVMQDENIMFLPHYKPYIITQNFSRLKIFRRSLNAMTFYKKGQKTTRSRVAGYGMKDTSKMNV